MNSLFCIKYILKIARLWYVSGVCPCVTFIIRLNSRPTTHHGAGAVCALGDCEWDGPADSPRGVGSGSLPSRA